MADPDMTDLETAGRMDDQPVSHPEPETNPFTVDAARAAADRDDLAAWVAEFLASPGSDNPLLAALLAERPDSWLGPVQVPLDQLHRLAGPEDHPVLFTSTMTSGATTSRT